MAAAISTVILPLRAPTIRRLTNRASGQGVALSCTLCSCGFARPHSSLPLSPINKLDGQKRDTVCALSPSKTRVPRPLLTVASSDLHGATNLLSGPGIGGGKVRQSRRLVHASAAVEGETRQVDDADQDESASHRVVNFYHLVEVQEPEAELQEHQRFLDESGADLRGRIYISTQGINAQFSATAADAQSYAEFVRGRPGFGSLSFSADPVDSHAFPRLRLKNKPNLVSLEGGHIHLPVTEPEARAVKLSPEEWRQMLEAGAPASPTNEAAESGGVGELKKAVVLDIRNGYEWDVGHFEGAERPEEAEFRETPADGDGTLGYLEGLDKDAPVMMYCTGGIRCDIYSTALRKKGFTNLYTLEGGIANYLRNEGGDHWNGSLFVFDNRMVLPGDLTENSTRELSAAAPCDLCGEREPILPSFNCANIDCNKLFLCCSECRAKLKGCCCDSCTNAPRLLRPMKESGYYGSWKDYAAGEEGEASIASGRGEGRRRRRARKQAEVRAVAREEKAARKQAAREAMAKHQEEQAAA